MLLWSLICLLVKMEKGEMYEDWVEWRACHMLHSVGVEGWDVVGRHDQRTCLASFGYTLLPKHVRAFRRLFLLINGSR